MRSGKKRMRSIDEDLQALAKFSAPQQKPVEEDYVQLATRIPRSVHRSVKRYCLDHDIKVMALVTAALRAICGTEK